MAKDKRDLLEGLRAEKHSCTFKRAQAALSAWGFTPGRTKGHSQVWNYKHITLTLHRPHKKTMDPGAVAMVIRKIEEAEILQHKEQEKLTHAH